MPKSGRYTEDPGQYVNIHGRDIRVCLCENTGCIMVPIDELKDMGFRLYQKDQYSRRMIHESQFNKEFNQYMLEAAQTYMYKQEKHFTESAILASIENVKKILLNAEPKTPDQSFSERGPQSVAKLSPSSTTSRNLNHDAPKSFMEEHSVKESSDSFTISTTLRPPAPSTINNLQDRGTFRPRGGFSGSRSSFGRSRDGDDHNNSACKDSFANSNSGAMNNGDQNDGSRSSFGHGNCDSRNGLERTSPRPRNNSERANPGSRNSFEPIKGPNTHDQKKSPGFKGSTDNVSVAEEKAQYPYYDLNKPQHTVIVSCIRQSQYTVQDVDNAHILLEIDAQIQKEIAEEPVAPERAVWGKTYLARDPDEDGWYRCRVIKFKPIITVTFVDFGNVAELQGVHDLREVSERLLKYPGQAVRVAFTDLSEKPELNQTVTIAVKKKYDSGIYLVETVQTGSESKRDAPQPTSSPRPAPSSTPKPAAVSSPKPAPTFFTKPAPLCKLANGQRVMIIGHIEGCIALRTKESYDVLKQIEFALEREEATAKVVEKLQKDQLVLCKKEKLHRAVVVDVQRNSAVVEFLDFCEKMKVDVSSVKYISEGLAKQPITYLMTPPIKGYSEAADEVLRKLGESKTKATVLLSRGEADLKLADELLSEKLRPPQPQGRRPTLDDFTPYAPPMGVGEFQLNAYYNPKNAYFVALSALAEYLEVIIQTELDDDEPYAPVEGEVCLGCYQDSWSRCVVLAALESGFKVRFVDFGNEETLEVRELRRLPEVCKEAPILAFACQLTGYPNVKNVQRLLEERMKEETTFEINVKSFNGSSYDIEVPEVYNALA